MSDVDVVAFGAHPDDIELGCGGTLIKMVDAGRSVVLVDLTRGELGTRGSADIRNKEAIAALGIIGANERENLELVDGEIQSTSTAKQAVVRVIRKRRPGILFVPYWRDRHPDHMNTSKLVYESAFLAGLPRYDTEQPAFRPSKVVYYMGWEEFTPSFVVDISKQFSRKMEAIYAYKSQFSEESLADPPTKLTSENTDRYVRSRMAYLGSKIGSRYGEGFLIRDSLRVDDPLALKFESF